MPVERPLRIGLVSDCYVPRLGGIEMQVHDLARHLQGAGHEVVVVTPTPGPAVMDGVRVQRIDVPLLPFDIPFTPKAFRLVAEILERERVDVAHFHCGIASPLAYGAARAAQRAGLPTVLTVHCMWSYAAPIFSGLNRLGHWTDWPVVLSAVSNVAAEPIRRIAGPDREVMVLPNGIDNDQWVVEPRGARSLGGHPRLGHAPRPPQAAPPAAEDDPQGGGPHRARPHPEGDHHR